MSIKFLGQISAPRHLKSLWWQVGTGLGCCIVAVVILLFAAIQCSVIDTCTVQNREIPIAASIVIALIGILLCFSARINRIDASGDTSDRAASNTDFVATGHERIPGSVFDHDPSSVKVDIGDS